MKRKRPAHCKGCMDFHNAGRRNPKGGLEKYNSWCCTFAKPAERAREQRVAREWTDKVEKVRAVAPDFDDAFANVAEITFAQSTLDAVAGHEKGAEIAYLLGKDPVKAYQIASLPPMQQLMAIGEIAAKTNLTRPKTVTNAPPPVKPVSGKSSIVDPNSLSMKEWVAYRNKQLRQK